MFGGSLVLFQVGGGICFAGGNLPPEVVRNLGGHDVLLNPGHLFVVHLDGSTSTASFGCNGRNNLGDAVGDLLGRPSWRGHLIFVLGHCRFGCFLACNSPAKFCVYFVFNEMFGGSLVLLKLHGSVCFTGGNLATKLFRDFSLHQVLLNPGHLFEIHFDGSTSTASFG